MSKTFFIIPGFKTQASDKQYRWLISYVKKNGWKVVKVPIIWNYRTLSQNARDFSVFYQKNKTEKNKILGFSYGAVIALMTANITSPDNLYLCSLSPDFKEDEKYMPKWLKTYIGKKRQKDILTRSGVSLAKKLKVPTTVFYGELEGNNYSRIKKRAEDTVRYAKDTSLVIIPNSDHDINSSGYRESIKDNLSFS